MSTDAPRPYDPERHAGRIAPIGAVLAVVGCCLGGWPGGVVAAVGVFLLVLSCVSAIDGLLIVGPFARFELVRMSRRRWRVWQRVAYPLVALALLAMTVGPAVSRSDSLLSFSLGTTAQAGKVSAAAGWFFVTFVVIQFAYLTFLTMQWIAPIIAEEREAKRLDLLLTTDLRSREILLGKAAGRLPRILEPALATLPVLALLPLFGGVSPRLVFAAVLTTVASIIGTAGLAFFYSVFAPTARKAIDWTFSFGASYILFSSILYVMVPFPSFWTFPTSLGYGPSPVELSDVVEWINIGNPLSVITQSHYQARMGAGDLETLLIQASWRYAAFQVGLCALFGLTAAKRLRTAGTWASPSLGALAVSGDRATQKKADKAEKLKHRTATLRPPVTDDAVCWWERYGTLSSGQLWIANTMTWRRVAWIFVFTLFLIGGVRILDQMWEWGPRDEPGYCWEIAKVTLRLSVWFGTWPLIIGPLFRGTASVARERVTDTLEGLRLTALTGREILFQKWMGQALSEAPLAKCLLGILAASVVTGLVPILNAAWIIAATAVYAASASAIGLYFSVGASTPGRASGRLMLIGGGGLYLFGVILAGAMGPKASFVPMFLVFPMAVTGVTLIDKSSEDFWRDDKILVAAFAMLAGVAFYAGLGYLAFQRAVKKFENERRT